MTLKYLKIGWSFCRPQFLPMLMKLAKTKTWYHIEVNEVNVASATNGVKHNYGRKQTNLKANLVQILMEFHFLSVKIWFWKKGHQYKKCHTMWVVREHVKLKIDSELFGRRSWILPWTTHLLSIIGLGRICTKSRKTLFSSK